jgi:hypothetical protein
MANYCTGQKTWVVPVVAGGRALGVVYIALYWKPRGSMTKGLGPSLLPSPRPWDFPPSIDGDISRADDPMELDDPE